MHMFIEGVTNANPSPPAPLPEGEGGPRPGEGIALESMYPVVRKLVQSVLIS